ncbi:hypothetical protein BYT27DRAFT_7213604 [Phlegmacium glaucopus]|nr:hypothetical protein BYT27DRAFT_7213604 [Phlegmacium glaucopus]
MFVGLLKSSKHPMRTNDETIRVRTQAVSTRSRATGRMGKETRDKRYSRIDERRTAKPSADRGGIGGLGWSGNHVRMVIARQPKNQIDVHWDETTGASGSLISLF